MRFVSIPGFWGLSLGLSLLISGCAGVLFTDNASRTKPEPSLVFDAVAGKSFQTVLLDSKQMDAGWRAKLSDNMVAAGFQLIDTTSLAGSENAQILLVYQASLSDVGKKQFEVHAYLLSNPDNLLTITVEINCLNADPRTLTFKGEAVSIDLAPFYPTLASVVVLTGPSGGTAVVDEQNRILYTPTPGFTGSDQVSYSVMNQQGESYEGVETIFVRDRATYTWNSYNNSVSQVSPYLTLSEAHVPGRLDLFYSTNDTSVAFSSAPRLVTVGGWLGTGNGWWDSQALASLDQGTGNLGRGNVARGSRAPEINTPSPTGAGIYDLALHPHHYGDTKMGVAGFRVLFSGSYVVRDMATRRFSDSCAGGGATPTSATSFYDSITHQVVRVVATADAAWINFPQQQYSYPSRSMGDDFFFAVDKDTYGWNCDYTLVTFSIDGTPSAAVSVFSADAKSTAVSATPSADLKIVLHTQPADPVTISLKTTENGGLFSVTSFTFTSSNWNVPQSFKLSDVSNGVHGSPKTFHIEIDDISSDDPFFSDLSADQFESPSVQVRDADGS